MTKIGTLVGNKCDRFCELLPKLVNWSLRNVPGFSLPPACQQIGLGGGWGRQGGEEKPGLVARNLSLRLGCSVDHPCPPLTSHLLISQTSGALFANGNNLCPNSRCCHGISMKLHM